jgi:hypothetical protein
MSSPTQPVESMMACASATASETVSWMPTSGSLAVEKKYLRRQEVRV